VRVREQHAEPHALEIILRGKTEASRMVVVRAETRSKVIDIAAEKGTYVQSGDVLVSLSDDDRQAKLQQAKALLAQRQIEFDSSMKLSQKGYRAETQVADAKAKLEEAKAAVTSMRSTSPTPRSARRSTASSRSGRSRRVISSMSATRWRRLSTSTPCSWSVRSPSRISSRSRPACRAQLAWSPASR
jgi:multidrug efflux pump subunit AcrA (membrane-fusion protein)